MLPADVDNKYNIDPDFAIPLTPYSTPTTVRIGAMFPAIMELLDRPSEGTQEDRFSIRTYDGDRVPVEVYRPEGIASPAPCLLYFHGGGFVMPANPPQKRLIEKLSLLFPFVMVAVNYRTALDHPFPAPLEDCYSTLMWAWRNSESLGIDRSRIAVYGDSAGGTLAAAVCLLARDRNGPPIRSQILLYPATDAEARSKSANKYFDTPIWNAMANRKMWEYYLPAQSGFISPYASPYHAQSLAGLPSAYIETAEFDPLHDEGVMYAERLQADGVDVFLHETRGTVHAYDVIKEENPTVQECLALRLAALKWSFQ